VIIEKEKTTIGTAPAKKKEIEARNGQIKARSRRPPPTTTARSCRSGWPSSRAAWR